MTIRHDHIPPCAIPLIILRTGLHDWRGRTSSARLHTYKFAHPIGVVGNMKPILSLTYAMAHSLLITAMTRPRVGARVFGARVAVAGLNISR